MADVMTRVGQTRLGDDILLAHGRLVDLEGAVYPLPGGQWRAVGVVRLGAAFLKGDPDQIPLVAADAEFEAAARGEAERWLMDWSHRTADAVSVAVLRATRVDPNGSRG